MKEKQRFGWGFFTSIIVHIIVGALFAGFGFLTIPQPIDKVIEISMIPSGGDAATVKTEEVQVPQEVAQPEDIVEEKQEEQVEEKPQREVREEKKPAAKTTSADTKEGTGKSEGKGTGEGSGERENVGVPIAPPRILSMPSPIYPSSARSAGQEGTVSIQVLVNADGGVDSAAVSSSSGYGNLDNAAVNAAYSWSFEPARDKYGVPCACYINLPVTFSLN